MSPSRLATFLLLSVSFLAPASLAQLPPNSSTTATPVPGAGHDYLGGPAETVNPANGSISISVPVIMPPGRGITLPFSFTYGSSGVNFLAQPWSNPGLNSNWYTTSSAISQGGWSNTAPIMSASRLNWQTTDDSGTRKIPCAAVINYVYQDARGSRHNMALTSYSDPNGTGPCTYNTNDWPRGFDGETINQGGEGSILATTPSGWFGGAAGSVTATDADGTSLFF